MSIEIGKANKLSTTAEKLGSSRDVDPMAELRASLEEGRSPSGRDFVAVALNDPSGASDILDAICEATGMQPTSAAEIAELFDFSSIEDVEYFFANLT